MQAVARFVEKPDAAKAADFLAGGRHLWNSGMFVATAATLLAELEAHAPEVLRTVSAAIAAATRDLDFVRLGAEAFGAAPAISIDYAVMEKTRLAAVVPASIGWSDLGSWAALWEVGAKDASGQRRHRPGRDRRAAGCFVRSEGMLTGVIGLKDIVVVTAEDAVLVMPRDRAQDVKQLVDQLRRAGRAEATEHRRGLPPLGQLRGADPGRPLPGEEDPGPPRRRSCRCRSTSTAPSTGWW